MLAAVIGLSTSIASDRHKGRSRGFVERRRLKTGSGPLSGRGAILRLQNAVEWTNVSDSASYPFAGRVVSEPEAVKLTLDIGTLANLFRRSQAFKASSANGGDRPDPRYSLAESQREHAAVRAIATGGGVVPLANPAATGDAMLSD